MKVGKLVTYWYQLPRWRKGQIDRQSVHVGLIVATGKYTGNSDVKVLWRGNTEAQTECTQHLELIDNIFLDNLLTTSSLTTATLCDKL